jgi:hypothetical protein
MSTYRDLKDELLTTVFCLEGVENGRKLVGIEFHYIKTLVSRHHLVLSFVSIFRAIRALVIVEKNFLITHHLRRHQ